MRILYVVTRAETGGAQVHVANLLRRFAADHDLLLAVGEDGYLTSEARELGIPVKRLENLVRPIRPYKDSRAIRDVFGLIRDYRPHLVHAHSSKAGLVARLAARVAGVPAVFTAHGWEFSTGTPFARRLVTIPSEWIAGRCSARIITVCEFDRKLARRFHFAPNDRLTVIHGGVADVCERADPRRSDPPVILMVARFSPQKAQTQLLHALASIDEPFRLRFVGNGPLEPQVRRETARLGLSDRVEFLGRRDDVSALLADASLFALPTNWEGLPLSILEASRAGLPTVATDTGGVSEAVLDGTTGYLVPLGDEDLLRDRILALLRDADQRKQMGDAARKLYEAQFTLDHMLTLTARVYEDVAGSLTANHDRV